MSCDTPSELYAFVAILATTISRTLMAVQLIPKGNTVKMLGGPNPNVRSETRIHRNFSLDIWHSCIDTHLTFAELVSQGWLGPWVTDSILGMLVPVMISLSLTMKGVPLLVCLFAYNILGAYDYAHGLLTQYLEPQRIFMWKPAVPKQIYGSIAFGCICNIVCAVMLLQSPVVSYFINC